LLIGQSSRQSVLPPSTEIILLKEIIEEIVRVDLVALNNRGGLEKGEALASKI
jgi:hypothetical protein